MTICRLVPPEDDHSASVLEEVWFDRIYSPADVTCLNIWDGTCTVLVNTEVKTVAYDGQRPLVPPVGGLVSKAKVGFTLADGVVDYTCVIIRDDIIVSLSEYVSESGVMGFFVLEFMCC